MIKKAALLVILVLIVSACGGSKPEAKTTSIQYVDSINSSGVSYHYEGHDIVKIVLDFKFDDSLAPDFDPKSDEFRKELFSRLADGAHFYYDDKEIEHTWGYWPQDTGSNHAKEMTLFYVVPSNHGADSLKFVYDGDVLGEGASGIDTIIHPK